MRKYLPLTNPRLSAFNILIRIDKERSYADILLDRELSHGSIAGQDRGLLTELVYGVLRRQGSLDHIIRQFSSVRIDRMERAVLILLRVGLYQLFYLDRVPPSAAVNETVKLAKIHAPKASGFINAVLRESDRKRNGIIWPDKSVDLAGWIAAKHSTPEWIARIWLNQLGAEQAELLAKAMSEAPPVTVRVNTLKSSREELLEKLAAEQVSAEPCIFSPLGIQILTHSPLASLESFRQGLFTIQDESSQIAAMILHPLPGERIMDICAAPGGKTTCLAEIMGNSGEISACDINPRRVAQIDLLARRLGINIIKTSLMDAQKTASMPNAPRFARVLVDAPCSGLGVLRRNPEGKWWKSEKDVDQLVDRQKSILANAATFVSCDGVMVYSTCSTNVQENESVLDDFLTKHTDFVIEKIQDTYPAIAPLCTDSGYFRSWPHLHKMDGFFAARLRRK